MTTHPLSDEERLTMIREALVASGGDWHEATRLWSIQADLDWLLAVASKNIQTDATAHEDRGRSRDHSRNGPRHHARPGVARRPRCIR